MADSPSIAERISAARSAQAPMPETPEPSASAPAAPAAAPQLAPSERLLQEPRAAEEMSSDEATVETSPAETSSAGAAPEEDDDDGQPVETIQDLAEYLGADVGDLWKLRFGVDVDGETRNVSLSDVKDAYRETEKLQRERAQLRSLREQYEQEGHQAQEQIRRRLADAAELSDYAERALTERYQGVNWAQLKEEDPSQWSLLRQEYRDAQDQIQAVRRRVEEKIQEFTQSEQRQNQERLQQLRAREYAALMTAIPAWQEPSAFKQGTEELTEYLVNSAGFTSDEVAHVLDHRLIVLARKAAMYDRRESESQTAKKRVLKLGKRVAKPGATESKQTAQAQKVAAARSQLRKTGRTRDAVALLRLRRGQ